MGMFVLSKRKDNLYKFEFVTRKGNAIFISNPYELKFECEETIQLLKSFSEKLCYTKFKTVRGNYFFRVVLNEKSLATSRKYSTELMMQKGINDILKNISKSEVLDFSDSIALFDKVP